MPDERARRSGPAGMPDEPGGRRASFDLAGFGLTEMLRCGAELRRTAQGAPSMEHAAARICRSLYDDLAADAEPGRRACALVRFYKTHPFGHLPADLQRFASGLLAGHAPAEGLRCLTLLGTAGDEPAWNARQRSKGHQAIPLPSAELVEKAPMIAQLVRAFGLDLADVVRSGPDVVRSLEGKTYGVFHVPRAVGSPHIPAQDFVVRHRIRSVLGFGGSLASGDLFAVILFSRVDIPPEAADRFRTIALDVKGVLFGFRPEQTFG